MEDQVQRYEPAPVAVGLSRLSDELSSYLGGLDLPTENVLVGIDERRRVINNLPDAVQSLAPPQRQNAMYVSKFVAACVMGLFDAALNYLWDETVRNLRGK